ncbi:MAG TPA: type 1 glutamine amidotransferase domain-containing protein [Parachlamydiaceae bacterium]|nr:type 1 glutamine amidotransferase domain-containing protein [Parachlamydiaceae bacterium]
MKKGTEKILFLVADEYEDLELHYPRLRLLEAGKEIAIAGEKKDTTYKSKHGYPAKATLAFDAVSVSDFTAIVIPGGFAPDTLRANPAVLNIMRQFNEQKKLIAFICHAGWVPASAKILKGVKCTSYHTMKDDMINAGANWVDEEVVVDKNIISSRCPDDLPKFCAAILKYLTENPKS